MTHAANLHSKQTLSFLMVMKLVSLILVFILTGINVTAAVPSGASTGIYEAVELRDGDKNDHLGKSKTLYKN